jgi:hypothetical protein
VFIELNDRPNAIKLFEKLYLMPQLPFYEGAHNHAKKIFSRQMRAYLVKEETTFERLAVEKYHEDELAA